MKHHTAAEYGVTAQGLKGDKQMKYYPTDYKNIEIDFKEMRSRYKLMALVHGCTTSYLLALLSDELSDGELIPYVMAELCERGGLDMADYKDFDDCCNAILHEFDVRNGDEK